MAPEEKVAVKQKNTREAASQTRLSLAHDPRCLPFVVSGHEDHPGNEYRQAETDTDRGQGINDPRR